MDNFLTFAHEIDPSEAAFAGGVVGGVVGTILVVTIISVIIAYILQIIAWWKIFVKAGEKGWKALIPFYNVYIFYKIVGMKNWFWGIIGMAILASIVSVATGFNTEKLSQNSFSGANLLGAIVYAITGIASCIIQIIQSVRVSKAFGHGAGFALGLIFLTPIFLLILGFGRSKYDKKVVKAWGK